MNVSDDNEITAGGTAVHRQAMVLRQSNRYIGGAGHGNNGVSYVYKRICVHAYLCVCVYAYMYMRVCVYECICVCVCMRMCV